VRTRGFAAILLLGLLFLGLLTACADDPPATPTAEDSNSASSPTTAQSDPSSEPSLSSSAEQPEQGTKVIAAQSDFGTILFDEGGQAIYVFDVETTSRPRCYGPCADAWPPVLTDGAPLAGKRVRESLLGTTPRSDGTTQVTYEGHPLYFYAHEGKHEVECHDIFLNGGNWYAVQPSGQRAP
jgi:predicted lipoprotein with Yx(FWY)xxD motif